MIVFENLRTQDRGERRDRRSLALGLAACALQHPIFPLSENSTLWNDLYYDLQPRYRTTGGSTEPAGKKPGFFAIPDIYVDERGRMYLPWAVTSRIDPDRLAQHYGLDSIEQLSDALGTRKHRSMTLCLGPNRTSNRTRCPAEQALVEIRTASFARGIGHCKIPCLISEECGDVLAEREDDFGHLPGHLSRRFLFTAQLRSRDSLETLAADIWIIFCRDLVRFSPNTSKGKAYTLLDARARNSIVDERLLLSVDLSKIFRCVQAKHVTNREWRDILKLLFPTHSDVAPHSQGYQLFGSLALYREAITELGDDRLAAWFQEAFLKLGEGVRWLPCATIEKIWSTRQANTSSWRYYGLNSGPAPRIAVRMASDMDKLTVNECNLVSAVADATTTDRKRKASVHADLVVAAKRIRLADD